MELTFDLKHIESKILKKKKKKWKEVVVTYDAVGMMRSTTNNGGQTKITNLDLAKMAIYENIVAL